MTNKVYFIAGAVLIIAFFATLMFYYKGKYETCQIQLQVVSDKIATQNTAIERMEVDTKTYKEQLGEQKEKIVYKYKEIRNDKELESCEAKLAEINKALEAFYE